MKKLLVILLLAFFTVGISSCAEDFNDTDPIVPEVKVTPEAPEDGKSLVDRRKPRKMTRVGRG